MTPQAIVLEVMRRLTLTPIVSATPEVVARVVQEFEQTAPGTATPARVMDVLRDVERAVRRGAIVRPHEATAYAGVLAGLAAEVKRPSGLEWDAIVQAYRDWTARPGNADKRPTQAEVAAELTLGERTLVRRLRSLDVWDWRDVHALVRTGA